MHFLLRLADGIERLNERVGRGIYWITLVMIIIGAVNAIARYTDQYTGLSVSSNTYLELQWYLFAVIFLVGAAYTLKHDAHVRVDVLYGRLSDRGKAWLNLAGTLLLLIPFCLLVLWVCIPAVTLSWQQMEVSPDPGGLPRYPIKSVIPLAFVLLLLQGIAMSIRQIAILRNTGE